MAVPMTYWNYAWEILDGDEIINTTNSVRNILFM
jgi:hypothetical protein